MKSEPSWYRDQPSQIGLPAIHRLPVQRCECNVRNQWLVLNKLQWSCFLLMMKFIIQESDYDSRLYLGGHIEYFGDLFQNALALFLIVSLNGSDYARIQVIFQNLRTDLVQRGFHRLDLADDVNA